MQRVLTIGKIPMFMVRKMPACNPAMSAIATRRNSVLRQGMKTMTGASTSIASVETVRTLRRSGNWCSHAPNGVVSCPAPSAYQIAVKSARQGSPDFRMAVNR